MGFRKIKRTKTIANEFFAVTIKQHGDELTLITHFVAKDLDHESIKGQVRIADNRDTVFIREFCRIGNIVTKAISTRNLEYDYADIVIQLDEIEAELRTNQIMNNADIPEVEEKPKYNRFNIPSITGKVPFSAIETIKATTADGRYVRISHDGENVHIQVTRVDSDQKMPAIYEVLLSQKTFQLVLTGLCETHRLINNSEHIDLGAIWKVQSKTLQEAEQ